MGAKTIVRVGNPLRDEAVANGSLYPGYMIELQSTGKVVAQSAAGLATAEKAFAIENDLKGDGIEVVYASGDLVQYAIFKSGEVVRGVIAANDVSVIGSKMAAKGDGTVHVAGTGDTALYVALEAVDGTGGATLANRRIDLRVI
jgi:hypothetical protein